MTLTGGLRDRMLFDSMMNSIIDNLTGLGWFDGGRYHQPITVVDAYPDENTEPAINTLAFSVDIGVGDRMEMGSRGEIHVTTVFVDFFAESDALARHVIGDVYTHLKSNDTLPVYDYRQATPPIDFYVEVEEGVDKRTPTRRVNPWQKHWAVCSFQVSDRRTNE